MFVRLHESQQLLALFDTHIIGVQTQRIDTESKLKWRCKQLRYCSQFSNRICVNAKTVSEVLKSQRGQSAYCGCVEGMRWRHKHWLPDTFSHQNVFPGLELGKLLFITQAGKFRLRPDRYKARVFRDVPMCIAVLCNYAATCLPFAHLIPEISSRRLDSQLRILAVRNNAEQERYVEFGGQGINFSKLRPSHTWRNIVYAQNKFWREHRCKLLKISGAPALTRLNLAVHQS